MTTGTTIIKRALQGIGAHSIISPASPASIVLGMEKLNSMLEMWLSQGIPIGFTPLKVPGDELNELPDARNGIIYKLSIQLAPDFDNGKNIVSQTLLTNANVEFAKIEKLYAKNVVLGKVVSSTLPVGQGNSRGVNRITYFPKGATING